MHWKAMSEQICTPDYGDQASVPTSVAGGGGGGGGGGIDSLHKCYNLQYLQINTRFVIQ